MEHCHSQDFNDKLVMMDAKFSVLKKQLDISMALYGIRLSEDKIEENSNDHNINNCEIAKKITTTSTSENENSINKIISKKYEEEIEQNSTDETNTWILRLTNEQDSSKTCVNDVFSSKLTSQIDSLGNNYENQINNSSEHKCKVVTKSFLCIDGSNIKVKRKKLKDDSLHNYFHCLRRKIFFKKHKPFRKYLYRRLSQRKKLIKSSCNDENELFPNYKELIEGKIYSVNTKIYRLPIQNAVEKLCAIYQKPSFDSLYEGDEIFSDSSPMFGIQEPFETVVENQQSWSSPRIKVSQNEFLTSFSNEKQNFLEEEDLIVLEQKKYRMGKSMKINSSNHSKFPDYDSVLREFVESDHPKPIWLEKVLKNNPLKSEQERKVAPKGILKKSQDIPKMVKRFKNIDQEKYKEEGFSMTQIDEPEDSKLSKDVEAQKKVKFSHIEVYEYQVQERPVFLDRMFEKQMTYTLETGLFNVNRTWSTSEN